MEAGRNAGASRMLQHDIRIRDNRYGAAGVLAATGFSIKDDTKSKMAAHTTHESATLKLGHTMNLRSNLRKSTTYPCSIRSVKLPAIPAYRRTAARRL
jgi:hypothetical protein